MPTLRNAADRAAILARLDRLTGAETPRWGRFTVPQMLAHMSDACRMALGELSVKPRGLPWLVRFPVKLLILHVLPFPKNAPTAAELVARTANPLDAERAQLKQLIARLEGQTRTQAHPLFGPMTPAEWGTLGYKHLDHHLRQFGV
jgi:hypothetical protein